MCGILGFLDPQGVDAPTALALAERLTELIDDADKRAEYGAASRRRVEKYDWTNIADAYLDLLERAAAERDDA